MQSGILDKEWSGGENMRRARVCADLDGGVDGVADDAGVRLPCAEPNIGDLGAGVQHEMPRHRRLSLNLSHWALFHTAPELEAVVVARGGREARLRSDWLTRVAAARWCRGAGLWLATVSGPRP